MLQVTVRIRPCVIIQGNLDVGEIFVFLPDSTQCAEQIYFTPCERLPAKITSAGACRGELCLPGSHSALDVWVRQGWLPMGRAHKSSSGISLLMLFWIINKYWLSCMPAAIIHYKPSVWDEAKLLCAQLCWLDSHFLWSQLKDCPVAASKKYVKITCLVNIYILWWVQQLSVYNKE